MRLAHARLTAAAALLACASVAVAADPAPLRQRPPASAQADGAEHTLRQIPEACVRLQGRFGGATGYRLQALRSAPGCQPRARFAAPGSVQPDPAAGWQLDERIVVPSASRPGCRAELAVWKRPAGAASRDGQGQVRVYLDQGRRDAAAGSLPALAQWTAVLVLAPACGGASVPDQA